MYDQVVKCQRAGLCLSEHFLIFIFYRNGLLLRMFISSLRYCLKRHLSTTLAIQDVAAAADCIVVVICD